MSLTADQIEEILAAEVGHECAGVGEHKIRVRIVAIAELPCVPAAAAPQECELTWEFATDMLAP